MNNNEDDSIAILVETLLNIQAIGRVETEDETGEGAEEIVMRCQTSVTKNQRRSDAPCHCVLQSNILLLAP
jgi:hypothetical protein